MQHPSSFSVGGKRLSPMYRMRVVLPRLLADAIAVSLSQQAAVFRFVLFNSFFFCFKLESIGWRAMTKCYNCRVEEVLGARKQFQSPIEVDGCTDLLEPVKRGFTSVSFSVFLSFALILLCLSRLSVCLNRPLGTIR